MRDDRFEKILGDRPGDVDVGNALQAAPSRIRIDFEHLQFARRGANEIDAGIIASTACMAAIEMRAISSSGR